MYRCFICRSCVPPRTPAIRLVLETRQRRYPPRPKANPARRGKGEAKDDPGGEGREIVREAFVCSTCAARHGQQPTR